MGGRGGSLSKSNKTNENTTFKTINMDYNKFNNMSTGFSTTALLESGNYMVVTKTSGWTFSQQLVNLKNKTITDTVGVNVSNSALLSKKRKYIETPSSIKKLFTDNKYRMNWYY